MDVNALIEKVQTDVAKAYIPVASITSRLPYVTPQMLRKPYFTDPAYFPTYYHLGKHIQPKSVLDMTFGNGFALGSLLLPSKNVEQVLAFQAKSDDYYPWRLAKHNIKQVFRKQFDLYVGQPTDKVFNQLAASRYWDVVIVNGVESYDDLLAYMRLTWPYISHDGLMIVDYINYHSSTGRAYSDFCNSCNKPCYKLKSKYGIGLINK